MAAAGAAGVVSRDPARRRPPWIIENQSSPRAEDAAALVELDEWSRASARHSQPIRVPPARSATELLGALAGIFIGQAPQIEDALNSDFGSTQARRRSDRGLGPASRAGYAIERLGRGWPRSRDGPMRPCSAPAWPLSSPSLRHDRQRRALELPLRPVSRTARRDAGRGNRVVIKPSEYAPACGELLRDMISGDLRPRPGRRRHRRRRARRPSHGSDGSSAVTSSTAVGREIAKAAAEQLVPVTLELGGKCPAIIAEDSIDRETVKQLLGTKAVKNGQMCISVDYCLVPRRTRRRVRAIGR